MASGNGPAEAGGRHRSMEVATAVPSACHRGGSCSIAMVAGWLGGTLSFRAAWASVSESSQAARIRTRGGEP
jgi:hypothetical protein